MEINQFLPMLITIIITIVGSWITIRINITEIKKDTLHLKERLDSDILNKGQLIEEHKENMKEVRDDVKAIFSTLTKIQVEIAKNQSRNEGRTEILSALKDAVNGLNTRR